MSDSESRTFEKITRHDLRELLVVGERVMDQFFVDKPRYAPFRNKLVLVALCQGAADHYCDGITGIKDYDVWFFYAHMQGVSMPRSSIKKCYPEFNCYKGKKVDVLRRSDSAFKKGDVKASISRYLTNPTNPTPICLSGKAVIGLYPPEVMGEKLWRPSK